MMMSISSPVPPDKISLVHSTWCNPCRKLSGTSRECKINIHALIINDLQTLMGTSFLLLMLLCWLMMGTDCATRTAIGQSAGDVWRHRKHTDQLLPHMIISCFIRRFGGTCRRNMREESPLTSRLVVASSRSLSNDYARLSNCRIWGIEFLCWPFSEDSA